MSSASLTGYERKKESSRRSFDKLSRTGRDIAPLPGVKDKARKEKAVADFRFFCESYFPETFTMGWSDDHLTVLEKTRVAVLEGGLFALAMPRGSGKTTIAETAVIWAIVAGHHPFVCLIGSGEDSALEMLDSVKAELENNDLLLDDFPEVCYPIRRLEGISVRANGQILDGRRTHISWTGKEIVLPTVPGSPASGTIVKTTGITGRIRGMKYKRPDGVAVRPSLVILDDPQTDESARSPSQCATREAILAGAVLGLAGPGQKISGIMPCTVIKPGDMAERILDRDIHPQWNGERMKLVYDWPKDEELWRKYAEVRDDGFRSGHPEEASEFYRKNRKKMDAGSRVAWEERFNDDELSAIQHAWNLRLRDEVAFFAEYQNEPLEIQDDQSAQMLQTQEVITRTNGFKRREIPLEAERLTAFIDVQQALLYYVIAAWKPDFSGWVVDYGAFPDQKRQYFTLSQARPTLQDLNKSAGLEGQLYGGLESLVDMLFSMKLERDDGAEMPLDMVVIDANWSQSTDVVYQFIRNANQRANLLPSHGRYAGASSRPFSEYRRKRGDRLGNNWRIPAIKGKRAIRHLLYDTNFWKSFVLSRLRTSLGDPGALTVFQGSEKRHRLLADHLTSEFFVRTQGRGREVDEWRHRPERFDNHWLDCLVGSAVAASVVGVDLMNPRKIRKKAQDEKTEKSRRRVSYL